METKTEIDYQRFIEDNFDLIDKNERRVRFNLNSVQKKLYDALCGRDIILKARQEGVSTLILALFCVDFILMDNSRSVCIAHDKDSTIKLFDRVKFFIKSFSEKTGITIPMQYETKSEMVNESNGAYFYVGTAGSRTFGRSATLTNVHFSEIAFYQAPEEIYLAASQAGTPRRVIIESTANGVGDFFYKMWGDAIAGQNNYKPHFYGWNAHEEYKAPVAVSIEPTKDEDELMTRHQLSKQQIAWRRLKMGEFTNIAKFKQEYPLTPEEAFISSGNPVFNIDSLIFYKTNQNQMKPPKFIGNLVGAKPPVLETNEKGYLKIWQIPKPEGQYVIGADPAEGTIEGDYSCAQVLDRRTFEQVAVWHGKCDPDIFGRELNKLGMYYNEAMLAPENNSMGIAVVLVLRDLYYPNLYIREKAGSIEEKLLPEFGWKTDMKTKPFLITSTGRAIRDKLIMLHDEATLMELFSYQYDESGAANATTGAHDDRVIALMIAIEIYNRTPVEDRRGNDIAHVVTIDKNENNFEGGSYGDSNFSPSPDRDMLQ